jgi:hypothetical protein
MLSKTGYSLDIPPCVRRIWQTTFDPLSPAVLRSLFDLMSRFLLRRLHNMQSVQTLQTTQTLTCAFTNTPPHDPLPAQQQVRKQTAAVTSFILRSTHLRKRDHG